MCTPTTGIQRFHGLVALAGAVVLLVVTGLVSSAAASSSSTAAHASVTPNVKGHSSVLKLTTGAMPTQSSLPQTETVLLKGFSVSTSAAGAICASAQEAQNTCPSASEIGTGSETVSTKPAIFGALGPFPLGMTFYLGAPRSAGCAATLLESIAVVRNTSDTFLATNLPPAGVVGDLCARSGGLQLSFPALPSYAYYLGTATVTISNTQITLGTAAHGKGVFKNPSSCPASRAWAGSVAFTFATGAVHAPVSIACKR
jgi:hypothetical protein